ncbi:MAG: serine protease [Bacteroidetes bacterium]|nr:serine protease [Bacteroidota bacterium]
MVEDISQNYWIFRFTKSGVKSYPLKLRIAKEYPIDIAIFDLQDPSKLFNDINNFRPLKLRQAFDNINVSELITLLGWPSYTPGETLSIRSGNIVGTAIKSGRFNMLYLSPQIIEGNSGGPVLDKDDNVIGIAQKGNNSNNPNEVTKFVAMRADILISNF